MFIWVLISLLITGLCSHSKSCSQIRCSLNRCKSLTPPIVGSQSLEVYKEGAWPWLARTLGFRVRLFFQINLEKFTKKTTSNKSSHLFLTVATCVWGLTSVTAGAAESLHSHKALTVGHTSHWPCKLLSLPASCTYGR